MWVGMLLLATPLFGQDTQASNTVKSVFCLVDGSRLIGQLTADTLTFHSPVLGDLKVPVARIWSLKPAEGKARYVVEMANEDKMDLTLAADQLPLKCLFGEVMIPLAQIRSIQFLSGAAVGLSEGLIARWSAENNSRDRAGDHHGELLFGAEYAPGKVGKAFKFNNDMARVTVPDSPNFEINGSFSVEGWIKVDEYPPEGEGGIIFFRGDNQPGLDTWSIGSAPNGQIDCLICSAENEAKVIRVETPKGEWFHLAMVRDEPGERLQVYVNGKLAKEEKTAIKPVWKLDGTDDAGIGLGNHGGRMHRFPFRGWLDEWGVYKRALSAEDVRGIMEAANAGEHIAPLDQQARNATKP